MIEQWMKLQAIEREINQELSQALKTIPEDILFERILCFIFFNSISRSKFNSE